MNQDIRDTRQTFNITHVRSMSPRESSFGSFSQLGSFHQGGSTTQMPTALEDIIKLKKELRLKQAEFEKEKALLQQKNDQMQSQLAETQERLVAQATMYESMINSLKAHDSSSTTQMLASKLQASERQAYEDEIAELKDFRRKLQEDLGNREHEYHKSMSDKESQMKEIQLQVERLLLDKSQQLFAWEIERKELQQKYQMSINDKEQAETKAEMRYSNKVNELQSEMDKLRLAHMIEVEKIKSEYENSLKDLKLLHEQEKQNLEYRLDRQSHDLRSLHHMVVQQDQATGDTAESTKQHRDMLSAEIGTIQVEVDKIKSQFDVTVQQLTKEKELAEARNEKLQKQLEKLKNAPKQASSVRIDLPFRPSELVQGPDGESIMGLQRQVKNLKEEVSLLQGENEKLNDQVKKMRKEAAEMQEYAEKLEQNEKKLRQVLNDHSLIEQDQIVELRRQLNMEKKRALEHSEIMSQMKENLEKENYKQQTVIIEKEKEIRALNADLRNHEKKLYDIQSMFNTQLVGNSMNMSGMLGGMPGENMHHRGASQQYPILGGLNMPGMGSVAYSQNNFSPQKFMGPGYINQSLNLQPSFVGQMNQMMMTDPNGQYQYQQNINDPHQMMLRSIQRMGDVLQMGQVECPHCFLVVEANDYQTHVMQNHTNHNVNASMHGAIPRSHSQSQLHSINNLGIGGGGNQFLSRQQAAQSVCVTSKSHANLPLYKKGFAEDRQQEVNMMNHAQSNQPVMYLSQQPPSNMGGGHSQQITRIPSFAQNHPVVQSSPRTLVGQRFAPNNRSFTCLLKEIDEEEEKNIVGSIPGGSRLNRDFGNTKQMAELMETSEDGPIPRQSCIESARGEDRKSRNLHQGSNLLQATKDGAGSTVNYGMTTGQTNTSVIKQEVRPSTSSDISQNQIHVRPYTNDPIVGTSRESLKSLTRKSQDKSSLNAKQNNISNEIKDLLEKLVTYQGADQVNQQVDTKFSQHSNHSASLQSLEHAKQSLCGASNHSYQDDHFGGSRQHNMISTESLVELRSSDESLYVLGGDVKTYDFRPHATARDMFKKEILKPSLGSGSEAGGPPVSSSVSNVYLNRKSQPTKEQKPPQNAQKNKSKSKTRALQGVKDSCNQGPKKPIMINTGTSLTSGQPKLSSLEQPCLSRESSSPPHNGGKLSGDSSDEKPPSVDRETARHTSKDTIMTNNMQHRHKKGRRYHEVNQSNVLTPNSPRRYQEYFKNKNADTQGYTGSLKSIPQRHVENKVAGGLTSAVKGLGQNKGKGAQPGMNSNVHQYQQNHRYSPSITQSVVNESHYQHISPEKPKVNKNTFVLDKGLPMQNQLQNVIENQKMSHPKQFYGNYDSGSVLCGGGPNSEYAPAYKMVGGLGFTPGGAGFIITGPPKNAFFDNSMDDDGEIRPSQIDEFVEKKENKAASALVGITSSYISIGDDDPFIAGKFQDASTKQLNFKPNSDQANKQYMK